MIPLILKLTKNVIDKLQNDLVSEGKNSTNEISINCLKECERITGEVVLQSFFGKDFTGKEINGKPITVELATLIGDLCFYTVKTPRYVLKRILFGATQAPYIFQNQTEKALTKRVQNFLSFSLEFIEKRMEEYK